MNLYPQRLNSAGWIDALSMYSKSSTATPSGMDGTYDRLHRRQLSCPMSAIQILHGEKAGGLTLRLQCLAFLIGEV
ncbi:MAG: hypothetical protein ACOX52_13940 [Verrucomicrobiota bacterium]